MMVLNQIAYAVDILLKMKAVFIGWSKHPGTKLWRTCIKRFSGNNSDYEDWTDSICKKIRDLLAKDGFSQFYRREDGRRRLEKAVWATASDQKIIETTRKRFHDDRKPGAPSRSALEIKADNCDSSNKAATLLPELSQSGATLLSPSAASTPQAMPSWLILAYRLGFCDDRKLQSKFGGGLLHEHLQKLSEAISDHDEEAATLLKLAPCVVNLYDWLCSKFEALEEKQSLAAQGGYSRTASENGGDFGLSTQSMGCASSRAQSSSLATGNLEISGFCLEEWLVGNVDGIIDASVFDTLPDTNTATIQRFEDPNNPTVINTFLDSDQQEVFLAIMDEANGADGVGQTNTFSDASRATIESMPFAGNNAGQLQFAQLDTEHHHEVTGQTFHLGSTDNESGVGNRITPTPIDVLFGRVIHPGNVEWRMECRRLVAENYEGAPINRNDIIMKLIDYVHNRGGRFLHRDSKQDCWRIASLHFTHGRCRQLVWDSIKIERRRRCKNRGAG